MKTRLISLLLLLSVCAVAHAEGRTKVQPSEYRYGKRGYFGTARVSYIRWSEIVKHVPAISTEVINGYSFNPWFMLGGGVGATYTMYPASMTSVNEPKGALRVPFYLHLRSNILDRRVSPFVAANLGGGFCKGYIPSDNLFGFEPEQLNGFYGFYYAELQLGLAVRLKNGKMVDFGVSLPLDFGDGVNGGGKFSLGFTW